MSDDNIQEMLARNQKKTQYRLTGKNCCPVYRSVKSGRTATTTRPTVAQQQGKEKKKMNVVSIYRTSLRNLSTTSIEAVGYCQEQQSLLFLLPSSEKVFGCQVQSSALLSIIGMDFGIFLPWTRSKKDKTAFAPMDVIFVD